jgi:hypothetical protein
MSYRVARKDNQHTSTKEEMQQAKYGILRRAVSCEMTYLDRRDHYHSIYYNKMVCAPGFGTGSHERLLSSSVCCPPHHHAIHQMSHVVVSLSWSLSLSSHVHSGRVLFGTIFGVFHRLFYSLVGDWTIFYFSHLPNRYPSRLSFHIG